VLHQSTFCPGRQSQTFQRGTAASAEPAPTVAGTAAQAASTATTAAAQSVRDKGPSSGDGA
jgi:hypothetical protein